MFRNWAMTAPSGLATCSTIADGQNIVEIYCADEDGPSVRQRVYAAEGVPSDVDLSGSNRCVRIEAAIRKQVAALRRSASANARSPAARSNTSAS